MLWHDLPPAFLQRLRPFYLFFLNASEIIILAIIDAMSSLKQPSNASEISFLTFLDAKRQKNRPLVLPVSAFRMLS